MSISCSKINELAITHGGLFEADVFPTSQVKEDWDVLARQLVDSIKACTDDGAKKRKIQPILYEIILLTSESNQATPLDVDRAARLIEETHSIQGAKVARMFTSLVNSFPEKSESLLQLIRLLRFMDDEFCTYITDDKLLEKTDKFTAKERALFKRSLLDHRYIIQKYNLLSEHPVGFSELITLLLVAYCDPAKDASAQQYWQEACSIIGKYSIDPLRALDVILIVSSRFITKEYRFLLKFLQASAYWPLTLASVTSPEALHEGGNLSASQLLVAHLNDSPSDLMFYDMTCLLIKAGFVSFLSIFNNVGPDSATIEIFTKKFYADLEADSMKGVSNPLAMAAALADDDESETLPHDPKKGIEPMKDPLENESELNEGAHQDETLQPGKMMLIQRLLAHGTVSPFLFAFNKYRDFLLTDAETLRLYLRLFSFMVTPLYELMVFAREKQDIIKNSQNCAPTHAALPTQSSCETHNFYFKEWNQDLKILIDVQQLFESSHEWLSALAPQLALSPILISKICRIGLKDIKNNSNSPECLKKWLDYMRKFVIPALPLLADNIIVINEVFELLSCFEFEKRYFIYNEMISKLSQDNVFVKAAWNASSREAKSALKALSIDNLDTKGKHVAKLISENPISTLEPVMNQLENYDKVSDLVVEISLYFSPFAYDVLQYVILLRMASGRQALQQNGVNVTMWVQRIAVFISSLAKHTPKMNISNIINLVLKKLHDGDMMAVTIIKELTSRVSGVKTINDMGSKQLIMLNSGRPLQEVARNVIRDTRDSNKESALRLLNIFIEQNSLSEVIILLEHFKNSMVSQEAHYKVISSRIDEVSSLLWSFIDMSKYFLGTEKFAENIVPFDQLVDEYSLSIEWAFFIWREYYDICAAEEYDLSRDFNAVIKKTNIIPAEFKGDQEEFFINFWKLSLYDVCFEKNLYDEEKTALEKSILQVKSSKKKRELSKLVEGVMASRIAHQRAHNKCLALLNESAIGTDRLVATDLLKPTLQYCVIPRILLSPADALFVVEFLWKSFGFLNSLTVFEEFVASRILHAILFSSTSSEASNVGLFFKTFLEKLEALRKENEISNENLKRIFNIHDMITEDIIDLISEKNYMSIRNGIEFMKNLCAVFPVVEFHISQMTQAIERLISHDKREDIQLPSNALLGHLKARSRESLCVGSFYELNDDEKAHYCIKEKEEIAVYHKALKAEQEEKRQTLLAEKDAEDRQTHDEEKGHRTNGNQSEQALFNSRFGKTRPLPMYEILNEMWDVLKCLEADRILYLNRHVRNRALLAELKEIEHDTIRKPRDFRARLTELFESYFLTLVSSPHHDKFQQRLNNILIACGSVTNPLSQDKPKPGRNQSTIAYDDEPLPKGPASTAKKSYDTRALDQAGPKRGDENRKASRYGGTTSNDSQDDASAKKYRNDDYGTEDRSAPNESRKGKMRGAISSEHKSESRYNHVSNSRNEESGFNRKANSPIPRGPARSLASFEKGGPRKGTPPPSKSGYPRDANTTSAKTSFTRDTVTTERSASSKNTAFAERGGPSKNSAADRGGSRFGPNTESRFRDSPVNQIRIGDRSHADSSLSEGHKRSRDENLSNYPSKRTKPDFDTGRNRFENRTGPKREANYRDQYSGKRDENTNNRRPGFKNTLPSGPRAQANQPKSASSRETSNSSRPTSNTNTGSRYMN